MTDRRVSVSVGKAFKRCASREMAKKKVPRMMPIHVNVTAALCDSEGLDLNAGTPFEIASVPDSAIAPDENARSTMRKVRPESAPVVVRRCSSALASSWIGESPPKYERYSP